MKARNLISIFSLGLVFCSSCSSPGARNPASVPKQENQGELLNFDLTSSEAWKGGSRESEEKGFDQDVADVQAASAELSSKYQDRSGRVFHEKSHGCLTGSLQVRPDLPSEVKSGLFSHEATYDLIARFSNGVGFSEHDANPDVRGLALKIFPNDGGTPFDFLMTNNANPFGRDQAQFVEFMKANMKGQAQLIEFAAKQKKASPNELDYLHNLFRGTMGDIQNPAHERYWSGHTYVFKGGVHMKFNVYPIDWSEDDQWKYEHRGGGVTALSAAKAFAEIAKNRITKDKDFLREALKEKALAGPIHYVVAVQLEKDADSTPVEDTLVEWTEAASPSIPVADMIFDQQSFDEPDRDRECSLLRFTPGHFYPAHRPSGNMGRGRMFTYRASQNARGAFESAPDKSMVERWRTGQP